MKQQLTLDLAEKKSSQKYWNHAGRWKSHQKFVVLDDRYFVNAEHVKPRLLIRPKKQSNQCMQDYLMLLAEENFLRSAGEVCRIINIEFDVVLRLSDERLEKILLGELIPTSEIFFSSVGNTLGWHPDLCSRVCPCCLNEGRPIPETNNYPYSFTCEIHHVMLIDECPECKKTLMYTRKRRNYCNCEFDLRTCMKVSAEPWIKKFYQLFAPWRLLTDQPTFSLITKRADAISCSMLDMLTKYDRLNGRLSSRHYPKIRSLFQGPANPLLNHVYGEKLWEFFIYCHRQIPLPWLSTVVRQIEKNIEIRMPERSPNYIERFLD